MIIYIYQITNKINNKKYIGQTSNLYRRKNDHFNKLRKNIHVNPHLQSAFNIYGEENFNFSYEKFEVNSKEEANQLEKDFIIKFNSIENGFNITNGGTGGLTKERKLDFHSYCLAYLGNCNYEGMTSKTAKWLKCDSSTISTIKREISYNDFLLELQKLNKEEKQKILEEFENYFDIKNLKRQVVRKKLEDSFILDVLCLVSTYSKGTEQAILRKFNLSKGLVWHTMKENTYDNIKKQFYNMSKEEIIEKGKEKMKEWNLIEYSLYENLKLRYTNLFEKYNIMIAENKLS